MSNKKIIHDELSSFFDKKELLKTIEKKDRVHDNIAILTLVPTLLVLFVVGVTSLPLIKNTLDPSYLQECVMTAEGVPGNNKDETLMDAITFNDPGELETLEMTVVASALDKHDEDTDRNYDYPDFLKNITVPYYLEKMNLKELVNVRELENCKYTIRQNEITYFKEDRESYIKISYSNFNRPIGKYKLNPKEVVTSIYRGYKVRLYTDEEDYYATFTYNGYYVELETHAIDKSSFMTSLASILK